MHSVGVSPKLGEVRSCSSARGFDEPTYAPGTKRMPGPLSDVLRTLRRYAEAGGTRRLKDRKPCQQLAL